MNLQTLITQRDQAEHMFAHLVYLKDNMAELLVQEPELLKQLVAVKPEYLTAVLNTDKRVEIIQACINSKKHYLVPVDFKDNEQMLKEQYRQNHKIIHITSFDDCLYVMERNSFDTPEHKHQNYMVAQYLAEHFKEALKLPNITNLLEQHPKYFAFSMKNHKQILVDFCIKKKIAPFKLGFNKNERQELSAYLRNVTDPEVFQFYAKSNPVQIKEYVQSISNISDAIVQMLVEARQYDLVLMSGAKDEVKDKMLNADVLKKLITQDISEFYRHGDYFDAKVLSVLDKDTDPTVLLKLFQKRPQLVELLQDTKPEYLKEVLSTRHNQQNMAQALMLQRHTYPSILEHYFDLVMQPVDNLVGFYIEKKSFILSEADNNHVAENLSGCVSKMTEDEQKCYASVLMTKMQYPFALQALSQIDYELIAQLRKNNPDYYFERDEKLFFSTLKEKSKISQEISASKKQYAVLKV